MSITKGKREGFSKNQDSGILKSLLESQNIAILTFDSCGKITNHSNGFSNIFEAPEGLFLGRNINDLPLSKADQSITILDFKNGFASSQKILDVKLISQQSREFSANLCVELSFNNENFAGGFIHFEMTNNKICSSDPFHNLLSKSKFHLKEPIRISKHFAQKLDYEIPSKEPVQKEYIQFIKDNISSLENMVDHLLILENLSIYSIELNQINFEDLVLMETHNNKNIAFDFSFSQIPDKLYVDRVLMRTLLKLSVNFAKNYSESESKFLILEGSNQDKINKLTLKMVKLNFLNHPSFAIDRPLNRIVTFDTKNASGYELMIINQIVKMHLGELKIFNNNQNETQIEIYLPTKE